MVATATVVAAIQVEEMIKQQEIFLEAERKFLLTCDEEQKKEYFHAKEQARLLRQAYYSGKADGKRESSSSGSGFAMGMILGMAMS